MRKTFIYGGVFIAAVSMGLAGQTVGALAATAAAAQASEAQGLEEVVVVARRTEERLQDVPISVTAVTAETLKQTSISSGTDLIKLVPTLSVQQGATGPGTTYSLRGIRTGVVTYFNEVPTHSVGIDDQIWDLQSVQALAGPQGTLFGKNSTGGAILFVPQRPTNALEGFVEGSIGDYAFRQFTGVLNVPVNDRLKVRLGARVVRRDPVVENVKNGPDFQSLGRESYRASAIFQPTDKIQNYTVIDYSHRDEQPYALIAAGWVRTAGFVQGLGVLPGYTAGQVAAFGDAQEQLGIRSTSSTLPAYTTSKTYGISNIFTADLLENLTFKYVAGYRYRESVENSSKANIDLPIENGKNDVFGVKDWSNEFQLQGRLFDSRVTWTTGVFTSRQKSSSGSEYSLFLPPGTLPSFLGSTSNRINLQTKTKAAFAQATAKVTDKLSLTAGIRYTEDEATTRNSRRNPRSTFFGPNVCALPVGAKGVDLPNCLRTLPGEWKATTYTASADYRLTEKILIYAATRRGYNAGGFNSSVADTTTPGSPLPTYNPEFITDYEGGIKADWSVGGMPIRTNLAIYQAKYTDIQRNQRGFSSTGQIIQGTANGPEATIRGAQLESTLRPIPELTITANYGYLFTRYDKGSNGFAQGNKFAQAPENTLNLAATYKHDLAAGGMLVGTLSYAYQSEINFQDDQASSKTAFQKAYGILDGRVGWHGVTSKKLDVDLFVKNITDEAYAVERQDQTALFGFTGTVYNDPRTYGVEVRYSFGG